MWSGKSHFSLTMKRVRASAKNALVRSCLMWRGAQQGGAVSASYAEPPTGCSFQRQRWDAREEASWTTQRTAPSPHVMSQPQVPPKARRNPPPVREQLSPTVQLEDTLVGSNWGTWFGNIHYLLLLRSTAFLKIKGKLSCNQIKILH